MIITGDCLEIMPTLPDKSIDMILCDLPYGSTACKWDTIIPFEPLWKQYKRLIKDNGAIVLTASQPFTSALVMSNPGWFKYCWYWNKLQCAGHLLAKKQPLKVIEEVCIFSQNTPYNPILRDKKVRDIRKNAANVNPIRDSVYGDFDHRMKYDTREIPIDKSYPVNLLEFNARGNTKTTLHPTQKPVALFEYLIRTYTNEGDTVLDNCAGSGTTGVACLNTGRKFILIEKEPEYIEIIKKRIEAEKKQIKMF